MNALSTQSVRIKSRVWYVGTSVLLETEVHSVHLCCPHGWRMCQGNDNLAKAKERIDIVFELFNF